MPSYLPQLPPVEVGFARPHVHRTRRVPDSQVHSKNRGVGSFEFDLALHDEVQEVFAVPPDQLGLANFEVIGEFTMGLDGHPNPATTELDRDANPVASDFGITALDSDEVFSNGERVFSIRLDSIVEPLGLLLVRRVEFDAGVALQEPLESFVFVVEDMALDAGQPHDLRLDDFLNLHSRHQASNYRGFLSHFWGGRGG